MKLLFLITIFILNISSYESFKLSRTNFIRNGLIHFTLNKNKFLTPINEINYNALIISCNKIGKQVIKDLKDLNIKTTVTTTKERRIDELSKISNEVVLIPQMEINNDEIMRETINNNDIIIIADTISIFSIHTFVRTCKRIANAIIKNKNNKKTIILISNVNVYGIHTKGKIVNEISDINNDNNNDNNDNNEHWQINHLVISKLMRIGENYLLDLMNNKNIRTIVLRTSTIFDNDLIMDIKNRDFKLNNYTNEIGNTYMSISLTEEIGNCIKWIINNDKVKGVFNLVSNSYKRKFFYDRLFDIIQKEKINWIDNKNIHLNKDYYYSMDENPLLPNSQRFNMKVDCNKIIKSGYKYKYKDIWKFKF